MEIKLNEHATGIILKELVRKALKTIRRETFVFEATQKEGYDGSMDDVFTSADTKAQDVYESAIKQCFPGVDSLVKRDSMCPVSSRHRHI